MEPSSTRHALTPSLAWQSSITTLAFAAAGTLISGSDWIVWTFIWDNYIPILTSNMLISAFLATYVYIQSFQINSTSPPADKRRELAVGGNTGNMVYDWFIGRELNPPFYIPLLGNVDIKTFMEIRPGLLGWLILDLAFMPANTTTTAPSQTACSLPPSPKPCTSWTQCTTNPPS